MLSEIAGTPAGSLTRRRISRPKAASLGPAKYPSLAEVSKPSTPRGLSGPSPEERLVIRLRNAVVTIGAPFRIELLRITKPEVLTKLPDTAPNMLPPMYNALL